MDGRHRAVVAAVQRLQHVERLGAAHLADDDPVRAHPERVADELPDRDLALSLEVRRSALEPQDVGLLEPKLRRVLDRDDPLAVGDQRRKHVSRVVLPEPVPPLTTRLRARPHAHREERASSGVSVPFSTRSSSVKPWRRKRLIVSSGPSRLSGGMTQLTREPSGSRASTSGLASSTRRPSGLEDPLDQVHQLLARRRTRLGPLDPARALDPNGAGPVDHDLVDLRVVHQSARADRDRRRSRARARRAARAARRRAARPAPGRARRRARGATVAGVRPCEPLRLVDEPPAQAAARGRRSCSSAEARGRDADRPNRRRSPRRARHEPDLAREVVRGGESTAWRSDTRSVAVALADSRSARIGARRERSRRARCAAARGTCAPGPASAFGRDQDVDARARMERTRQSSRRRPRGSRHGAVPPRPCGPHAPRPRQTGFAHVVAAAERVASRYPTASARAQRARGHEAGRHAPLVRATAPQHAGSERRSRAHVASRHDDRDERADLRPDIVRVAVDRRSREAGARAAAPSIARPRARRPIRPRQRWLELERPWAGRRRTLSAAWRARRAAARSRLATRSARMSP